MEVLDDYAVVGDVVNVWFSNAFSCSLLDWYNDLRICLR